MTDATRLQFKVMRHPGGEISAKLVGELLTLGPLGPVGPFGAGTETGGTASDASCWGWVTGISASVAPLLSSGRGGSGASTLLGISGWLGIEAAGSQGLSAMSPWTGSSPGSPVGGLTCEPEPAASEFALTGLANMTSKSCSRPVVPSESGWEPGPGTAPIMFSLSGSDFTSKGDFFFFLPWPFLPLPDPFPLLQPRPLPRPRPLNFAAARKAFAAFFFSVAWIPKKENISMSQWHNQTCWVDLTSLVAKKNTRKIQ